MQQLYKNKVRILWTALCVAYVAFIAFFSFLYPYGINEYEYTTTSLLKAVETYFIGYLQFTSRLGFLFTNIILYFGKWSFIVINPIVQLAIVFLSFFLVFMRWPNLEKKNDMYVFMLIALLTVFAVAMPGNTIFWISGACTYRWVFAVFLALLCFFRLIIEHEYTLPDNIFTKIGMLSAGFVIGMSNKSNGPMAVIVFVAFFIYCKIKKISTPLWFYWGFTGVAAGVIALFAAPGPYKGPNMIIYSEFKKMSAMEKLFLHIPNINDFMYGNLMLPIVTLAGFGLAIWDKKIIALKNIDFICSFVFWLLSLVTAVLLFVVPSVPMRAFYCASMFSIFAFLFIVKYLKGNYSLNIYKYLFMTVFIASVVILPLFAMPYFQLYKDNKQRMSVIEKAKEQMQTAVWCDELVAVKGPTKNLSITFFDVLSNKDIQKTKKYFGIQLINNKEIENIKNENGII